jgi:hypothetical protein
MNGPLVNFVLIRVVPVSEDEYDMNIDTDLPQDVVVKIIKDAAAGIDQANVTEYEEPFNG